VLSTRAKDFYDVFLMTTAQADKIDKTTLSEALRNTLHKRGKENLLDRSHDLVLDTLNSHDIQTQWKKYSAKQPYAAHITFKQISDAVITAFAWAGIELNIQPKAKASWVEEALAEGKRKAAEQGRDSLPSAKSKNGQEH
jgi:hypothetical protein